MVGIDISGRDEEEHEYRRVAAAIHATVGTTRLHSVQGMGFAVSHAKPALSATKVVADAVCDLPDPTAAPIIAERGEFYEEPIWMVEQYFEPEFKYVESIAERETVQAAHHAAYTARKLLL